MKTTTHFNNIVAKAHTINRGLNSLRSKCESLIDEIQDHKCDYDEEDYEFFLQLLEETLIDLKNFDLEDSIPNFQ